MVKCLVLEDDLKFLKNVVSLLKKYTSYEIIEVSTLEKMDSYRNQPIDIAFLDVIIGDDRSIPIGKELAKKGTVLVYMSVLREFAFECYDINVIDFIDKFHIEKQINQTIKKIDDYLERKEWFTFISDYKTYRIQYAKIISFEKIGRTVIVSYEDNGEIEFKRIHTTIKELKNKLNQGFIEIHQGIIINRNHIIEMNMFRIKLTNKNEYYMSRRKRKEIKERFITE